MTSHPGRVAGLLLAAGEGSRLRGDVAKPLAPFVGRPLVRWAIAAVRDSGLAPRFVVVGHAAAEVRREVPADFAVLENLGWRDGIASSLRVGVEVLEGRDDVDAVVVGLVDQPLVSAEAYRRVAAAYDAGAQLAAATYSGRRANPVLIARELWGEVAALTGDVGARQLMSRHPVLDVACDGVGDPTDIDTRDDLVALEARWRSTTASG